MNPVTRWVCRTTVAAVGGGAVILGASATASAEPPPNCTAADVVAVMSGVSTDMAAYLFTHPDVNTFFTGLQGQSKSAVADQTKDYLNKNPQVHAELDAIRRPAVDLRNRCNIPVKAEISNVI